jgi:glyoxylase-like metal-dependent hydrolase (beta-lactamase superfamily II)
MPIPTLAPVPTDQPWFAVFRLEPGVFIIEEPWQVEQVKSFLVTGRERAMLLDTGCGVGDMRRLVESLTDLPVIVVNSHAHWDHIGGNAQFGEIWIHEAEADELPKGVPNTKLRPAFSGDQLTGPLPDGVDAATIAFPPTQATRRLVDGNTIDLGGRVLEVIHGPGHSPGGISLLDRDARLLFTTDVAYPGLLYVYGRESLPVYKASLARLAALAPDVDVALGCHNGPLFEPSLLADMVEAIDAIIAGKAPDDAGDAETWHCDGFGVMLFPPR